MCHSYSLHTTGAEVFVVVFVVVLMVMVFFVMIFGDSVIGVGGGVNCLDEMNLVTVLTSVYYR